MKITTQKQSFNSRSNTEELRLMVIDFIINSNSYLTFETLYESVKIDPDNQVSFHFPSNNAEWGTSLALLMLIVNTSELGWVAFNGDRFKIRLKDETDTPKMTRLIEDNFNVEIEL